MSGDNKRDGNQKVLVCVCLHQVGLDLLLQNLFNNTPQMRFHGYHIWDVDEARRKRGKSGCICAPEKGE